MVYFFSKCLGINLLAASAFANDLGCISRELKYPEIVDMDELAAKDEVFTLDMEWIEVNPGFGDQHGYKNDVNELVCGIKPFKTRALGGSIPGPTLAVSPGTTMRVKLKNRLTYQPESKSSRVVVPKEVEMGGVSDVLMQKYSFTTELNLQRLNKPNDPDITNLHFHGLHISGILPSDDTTIEVLPQEEYEYVIDIPEDHEPGMHWVHPHHHGSSTLQLVGGAAMAIIVKDPMDSTASLPAEIRDAPERVLIFQDWDLTEAVQQARHASDMLISESFNGIEGGDSIGRRFVTINGQYQPITEIQAGKWERWRILYAGWQDLPLEFTTTPEGNTSDCEFWLLAKDGIYLSDYPRGPMLETGGKPLPIPPGGRADFMVRCNIPGTTTRFEALSRRNILILNVVGDNTEAIVETEEEPTVDSAAVVQKRSATPLTPWGMADSDIPNYLQSVLNTPADNGCTCSTSFNGYDDTSRVNDRIYRPGNHFMHTTYMGAVVERSLKGMDDHSYHQHVYPYQIIDFPEKEDLKDNDYFKIGDWHDTYLDKRQKYGDVTIRYKTTDIPGKIMVHCHNTLHADWGMIQKEYVRNVTVAEGQCACDIFGPIDGVGIVDDINNPKVIGAEYPAEKPSSGARAFVGLVQIAAALVVSIVVAA